MFDDPRGSSFGGLSAERVCVPMFEEHLGVRVHEASEPPNGVGRAVRAVVVVPTGHFAFVLVATHMRGDADDGLMDVAVAEAAASITWAVFDLVVRLQFEAFVTECWLTRCGSLVRVVEGDVILVGRALRSSDCWHATATDWGTAV